LSIFTWDEALELRRGKRLVFTNGVFDVLHVGHLELLERARTLGDVLIVGINSDESVRRLGKGANRPFNTALDRARLLSALRCVDGVIEFGEDTPLAAIAALAPDVHVKGGDYVAEDLPEYGLVTSLGGQVVIVPIIEGYSTTRTARELGWE
jgi:glycerol-3-phosphate cytidylyltransferase